MGEELSRLMDGEFDEAQGDVAFAQLKRPDGMATWVCYHVIGDALRGTGSVAPGFSRRFAARLAAEPTVLAPQRHIWPQRVVVASLASLAVWGAVSLTGLMPTQKPESAPIASAPANPGFQQATLVAPVEYDSAQFAPYVVAHQEFAPSAVATPVFEPVVAVGMEPR